MTMAQEQQTQDQTVPTAQIDLNSDLGEGLGRWEMGDDEALLAVVTSANIACGFHASDASIMRRTCEQAVANDVRIGAHVGYRDLLGFGRRSMDVPPDELANDVIYQIGALAACARVAGGAVSYVKPHGALYNRIVWDEDQAGAVVDAIRNYDPSLVVLGLPGSRFLALAEQAGLKTVREGFVDRAYNDEAQLVSRRVPGSVLHEPDLIGSRAVQMAEKGTVVSVNGKTVSPRPQSLCLHGDTPGAADIAKHVRTSLERANITVVPFA